RYFHVTGVQTCALPICTAPSHPCGDHSAGVDQGSGFMLTRLRDFLGLRTGPLTFFVSVLIIVAFAAAMSLFPGPLQSAFGVVARSEERRVGTGSGSVR